MEFNYQFSEDVETGLAVEKMVLAPGKGKFKIKSVMDSDKEGQPLLTQAGEPKIKISVFLTDVNNNTTYTYEHITAKTGWKLGQILKAIGKGELYNNSGVLDLRHLVSGEGECTLKTKSDPGYPAATVVDKYLPRLQPVAITELSAPVSHANAGFGDDKDPFEDEELPF